MVNPEVCSIGTLGGRAALPRRRLADQQVSPAELAYVPMLIETAICYHPVNSWLWPLVTA